jgi:hypothetical protein
VTERLALEIAGVTPAMAAAAQAAYDRVMAAKPKRATQNHSQIGSSHSCEVTP